MRYLTIHAGFMLYLEVLMRYITPCGLYDLFEGTHALPHYICGLCDLLGGTHALPHSMWAL